MKFKTNISLSNMISCSWILF